MNICFKNCDDLLSGIELVTADLGFNISSEEDAHVTVTVNETEKTGFTLTLDNGTATITYGDGKARFFRALALLVNWIKVGIRKKTLSETPLFKTNGTMLDVSRNAVMKTDYLKFYLRKMALMGLNTFMLYTEDTYEIESRPYFGYMRGRYTKEELKDLDAYALKLGIELVPCIQVLGHLATALRWNAMGSVRDTRNALLADNEATYKLIDEMFKTVRECFSSNRLHMGMDETHDLGTGAYLDKFGYRERKEIYFDHLGKVSEMAKSYGFKPMMWSDMFFRMSAKGIENFVDYDKRTVLPDDIGKYLPSGVQPVFWDYYNPDEEFYAVNIEKHRLLSDETLFAGGVWFWTGHCPLFSRSFSNTLPALEACKKGGIKEVIATVWHNGSSSSLILSLAGLAWYADYDYTGGNFDMGSVRESFKIACNEDYNNVIKAELPDAPNGGKIGLSTHIFFNDPLIGLVDKHIEGLDTKGYYEKVTAELSKLCFGEDFAPAMEIIKKFSSLLENKADFGVRLKKAYDGADTETLKALACECDLIITKLQEMRNAHKKAWFKYNKPFGWEVHDIRYGGMISRFDTAKERILAFVNGETDSIDELKEERLRFDCMPDGSPLGSGFLWPSYSQISTTGILER